MSVRTGGLQSSAFAVILNPKEPTPIVADTKILADDIVIDSAFVNGDSGRLRFLFSFTTAAAADYQITLTKLGGSDFTSPLKLNADNTFILLSDGYYQFDISVEPGNLINFSANVNITAINDIQMQKIQIGT